MKSRRLELSLLTLFFLLAALVRAHNLSTTPAGFSDDEILSIRISKIIREGTIRVFFDTGNEGVEGLYHTLLVPVKAFVGEGLLGYRLLPFWFSMLSLALIYRVTRRLFGVWVAFIALGTMIFGIQPVLMARTASHVSMLAPVLLLLLWLASRAYYLHDQIRSYTPKTAPYTLLGVGMAVAAYTHYTGALMGIGIFIFVLYLRYTHQPVSRHIWWNSAYALILASIIGLPYIVSFLRASSNSGIYILWVERSSSPREFFESLIHTVMAFFWKGDSDPAYNVPGLPLIFTLEGALLLVGLGTGILRWRQPNYGLLLIFFGLGLLPDIWLRGGPSFAALALVSPLAYIWIGIGVVEVYQFLRDSLELPKRLAWLQHNQWLGLWPKPLLRLFIALLLFTAVRNFWSVSQHLFVDWPERDDTQQAYHSNVGEIAVYLDQKHDELPSLLCTSNIRDAEYADMQRTPSDAQLLEWMLHRDDVAFRTANCQRDFVLLNGGQRMQVLFVEPSDISALPSEINEWLHLAVPISHQALQANVAWELDAEQALADKGGLLQLDSRLFYPLEPREDRQPVVPPIRFGGNMTLLGHNPLSIGDSLQAGDVLTLAIYWRVDGLLLPDTGIFIRLHDTPQASPYAETNAFGVDPSRLQGRDVVLQVGYLTIPESIRNQEYRLTIGVYDKTPVNQLPVYDEVTGAIRGSYLMLGLPFTVLSH